MLNSFLAFCFWKACTFSGFERFLCWKSRNYTQIYLSRIINYCGSIILALYKTWGAFSLVFFFLSFLFFLFLSVFSLRTLNIHKMGREREQNNYFSCFPLPTANEHSFSSLRFLPLIFTRSICNYQTDSWWDLFSLDICILFAFSWMQLSKSYWLWQFKVTLSPSITKRTP